MSRGIVATSSHRRYGATDHVPEVAFADSNSKEEINKLCDSVAKSMQFLNNCTRKLEKDAATIGTARDSQNLRDNIRVSQLKCNEVVAEIIAELEKINGMYRSADKQTKLQVERLQTEMQTTVLAYGSVQKEIVDKTKRHVLQQAVSPTAEEDQFHLREQEAAYNQQQKQVQMELEFEGGMLEDRMHLIKNCEVEILNVNDVMRMLAALVHQQAPTIDRIEQYTENTLANVEEANQELIKASRHVGRRRRAVFCLAFVAIVILAIVLIILLTK